MDWQTRDMTPRQYRDAIKALNLNKASAGRFLGVSTRTSHRYWDGDTEIPPAHSLLLRVFLEYQIRPIVPPWRPGQN